MAAVKASFSEKELKELVQATADLKAYQEEEDPPELASCIPLLKRSDIRREAPKLYNVEKHVDDTLVLHHDVFTNGIAYIQLLFDTKEVPDELIPYMGLLKSVLGYIGTERYSYGELFHEINACSGGIACGLQVFEDEKADFGCRRMFGIRAKGLYSQRHFIFDMIREILTTSQLDDARRLKEILAELKARHQVALSANGHSTAVLRAGSYQSAMSDFQDRIGGVAFARFTKALEEHFEEKKEELVKNLHRLMLLIFRPENLFVSLTADQEGYDGLEEEVRLLKGALYTQPVETGSMAWKPDRKNEGLMTAGQVQYVAKCGNFKEAGYDYTGALRILKVIMGYDYLWMNIRVKGGAYGCMNGYRRSGDAFFVSYRDPNLKKTVDIYGAAADYVRAFEADERTMDKYVIGAISELDVPMTPNTKGAVSLNAWFSGITEEMLQKERNEILQATAEDIRNLAGIVECFVGRNNLCVVGSESAIKENEELFGITEALI